MTSAARLLPSQRRSSCETTGRAGDEAEILKLVARLAQASDDRDAEAYRACFADAVDSSVPGQATIIAADTYVRDAMIRLRRTEWTHHQLVNPVVEVEPYGIRAAASIDVVVVLCRTDDWGERIRGTMGGRYDLGFVRAGGAWRIDRRVLIRRYAYCERQELPA